MCISENTLYDSEHQYILFEAGEHIHAPTCGGRGQYDMYHPTRAVECELLRDRLRSTATRFHKHVEAQTVTTLPPSSLVTPAMKSAAIEEV